VHGAIFSYEYAIIDFVSETSAMAVNEEPTKNKSQVSEISTLQCCLILAAPRPGLEFLVARGVTKKRGPLTIL